MKNTALPYKQFAEVWNGKGKYRYLNKTKYEITGNEKLLKDNYMLMIELSTNEKYNYLKDFFRNLLAVTRHDKTLILYYQILSQVIKTRI